MSAPLSRLLASAAPAPTPASPSTSTSAARTSPAASPPASAPFAAPALTTGVAGQPYQPDSLTIATAARLILNAVSESVLNLSPASPASPASVPAKSPPALHADPFASAVSLPEVLRAFLSPDERTILKVLARPSAANGLPARAVLLETGIEKSKFWVTWPNLQLRGLVLEEGNGNRRLYRLGPDWLRLLLS